MNTKIEIVDVLQKLYWKIDEIENPYDKYNNNQAYFGFIKGIQAVKDVIANETLEQITKRDKYQNASIRASRILRQGLIILKMLFSLKIWLTDPTKI